MPAGGYFGRVLVVDATSGSAATLPLPDKVLRGYLGGAGLGTWLLHRLGPPGVDPLAPEARLAFVFSPLVGTPLTTSAKFAVVAKSPLTGLLTDALASSQFAIAGKLTGHDAIVVTGRAQSPSALLIDGDGARLADAADLAGPTAADADKELRNQLGRGWRVAAIGPAGRARRPIRDDLARRQARRPGRPSSGRSLSSSSAPSRSSAPMAEPRVRVPGVEARAGKFPGPSLIPALNAIQERVGLLPRAELVALSHDVHRPLYEIEGRISFYPHFRTEPPAAAVEAARTAAAQVDANGHASHDAHAGVASAPSVAVWPNDPYPTAADRYALVKQVLAGSRDTTGIIAALKDSGLRGMGGAGFPAGRKWDMFAAQDATPKYVICNADESEPGTFKDQGARTPRLGCSRRVR